MIKAKKITAKKEENIYCDKCGEKLENTGIVYATYPEQYKYICTKCNLVYTETTFYPRIVYEYEE